MSNLIQYFDQKFLLVLLLIGMVHFSSCNQSKKDHLLDEETYKNVFIELAIANHMDTKLLANISREELIEQIYEHYNVTPDQFHNTHDFFEEDIQKQAKRMEQILVILREERERIDQIEQEYKRNLYAPADTLRQRLLSR